jgi:hypothetical protein
MSSIIYKTILSKALITINNMNTNVTNTEEKYAWVDALLENCALQEQRDYEAQALEDEEANPEWNEDNDGDDQDDEDEDEDDDMEHCENCDAAFDTDRQLGYHQMVCKPGNNNLCADLLGCPPPLARQNACFLTEVVDESTGDVSLVETDAYGRMEVDEPEEDLIADESMEDDEELEDLVLYNIKRYNELTFAPFKKQKMDHEHPIPEPMDVCDSEEEDRDYMSENDELEPRQLFNDDDEEDKLSVMSDITVEPVDDDDEDEYLNDIWFLEQEALHRFPRRARQEPIPEQAPIVEDPHADQIFPVFDNEGDIIPMDIDEEEDQDEDEEEDQVLNLGPAPNLQRQNTQWVHPVTGQVVYNGNPDGSRT